MRIVAGRTKAACGIVFIKYGVHSLGDKGYVRYWHKADIRPRGLPLRKMAAKPHFASLKSLL